MTFAKRTKNPEQRSLSKLFSLVTAAAALLVAPIQIDAQSRARSEAELDGRSNRGSDRKPQSVARPSVPAAHATVPRISPRPQPAPSFPRESGSSMTRPSQTARPSTSQDWNRIRSNSQVRAGPSQRSATRTPVAPAPSPRNLQRGIITRSDSSARSARLQAARDRAEQSVQRARATTVRPISPQKDVPSVNRFQTSDGYDAIRRKLDRSSALSRNSSEQQNEASRSGRGSREARIERSSDGRITLRSIEPAMGVADAKSFERIRETNQSKGREHPGALGPGVEQASRVYSVGRSQAKQEYRNYRSVALQRSLARREQLRSEAVAHRMTSPVAGDPDERAVYGRGSHGFRDGSKGLDAHRHVHGQGCGHHFHGGSWHDFPRNHRHGPDCGHRLSNGVWHSFSSGHVHGPGCGHFLDNSIWLSFGGSLHRHGPGCGHYFHGGRWQGSSRRHQHSSICGHHFYEGAWHAFSRGHQHSQSCGHYYDGISWFSYSGGGHIHGNDCGHHFYEGRWNVYPRRYYRPSNRSSFFFFIDLGSYRDRHVSQQIYSDARWRYEDNRDVFGGSDRLSEAYAAFARGDYYESTLGFSDALGSDPGNGLLYLARAQSYIAIKDYRSAYDDLIRGMELRSDWADVDLHLAEIYADPEDFRVQFEHLEQWVEDHPRDYQAHFVLGYVYFFQQEYSLAKSELVFTLAWNEDHPQATLLMDRILEMEAESDLSGL